MPTVPTRRAVAAALVVPALVVAALAARSYRPFGGDGGSERAASTTFVDSLFTLALVIFVSVLAIGAFWFRTDPRRARAKRRSSGLGLLVAYLIVFLLVVAVGRGLLQRQNEVKGPPGEGGELAFPKPLDKTASAAPGSLRSPQIVWPLAAGTGVLLAAAVIAAVVVSRRRRPTRPGASAEALAGLTQALDDAIEDLRREPDPRRAVVAAYARMEQALSVYGLPRRPAETPYEYLGRVAKELDAEEPVADLTELFELAKFSEHSVDETMRGQAIVALSAVRDEVRMAA